MKISFILLFSLFIFEADLEAQHKYTLSGNVTGEKSDSIAAGSIYLLTASDSSIVKYALLVDGKFTFDPVAEGNYIVRVSSLGYDDQTRRLLLNSDIALQIALKANSTALKTVTIAAPKKDFSFKNGDVKINIAGSAFASIPNTVDLLAKLPLIQVSPNGEAISVLGKGNALIYIDRQKASLNDLATLSANDIQDVQIIKNPSAKYEAEGRAVIIITRKKDKRDGFQAEVQETASFRRTYSNYAGLNLNFKKKKWEVITSLKYNYRTIWESNAYDFRISERNIQTGYTLVSTITKPEYIGNLGLHYQIKTDDHISLNVNSRFQDISFPIYTNSNFNAPSGSNNVFTTNNSTYPKKNYTVNLNYEKKLKKVNADLFLGSQYAGYNERFLTDIFNNYNNTHDVYTEHRDQKYNVRIFGGRADLTKNFKQGAKFEVGGNVSTAKANAVLRIDNVTVPAHSSSDYLYMETNTAAYAQFSGKIKQLAYSIGSRSEYTSVKGRYKDSAEPQVRKNYWQLFPKASLSIPVGNEKNISLNYARSITRPNYLSLSQVTNYINPYFIWASNINVNPTTSDDISAAFQWKGKSVSISCYRRKNPIYASFAYDTAALLLTRTDINYNAETGAILDVTVPLQYGIWTTTNEATVILNRISDGEAAMGKTRPYLYFYSNNQFKLPGKMNFSLSGWCLTKRYEGAFERNALLQVDTSLTKTFVGKLNCTVSCNDIFRTLNAKEEFTLSNIRSKGIFYDNARDFSIAVRYSFGATRESKYRNKNVDANLNRL